MFQQFVTNLKATYEAHHDDNKLVAPNNELIPPGTSFQELIKLFANEYVIIKWLYNSHQF